MGTVIFPQPPQRATQLNAMKDDMTKVGAAVLAGAAIFGATLPAQAITKSELNQLSYLQVKGTGLANRCSEVIGEDTITPKSGDRISEMCIEPKAWAVEEEIGKGGKTEKKFVNSKVMTRQTYTLEGIEGDLKTDGGNIVFTEKEGDAEMFKENNKTFDVGQGRIEMEVNKVNAEEGEIGGVFVSSQPGDTDMGSKVPKKILTKGIFYAKVQ